MASQQQSFSDVLYETDKEIDRKTQVLPEKKPRKYEIVWRNVMAYAYVHILTIYGFFWVLPSLKLWTIIFNIVLLELATLGVTAGGHRLWSHRSFKVNTPLKIILVIMHTMGVQDSAIAWARDHRVHHKFTDTDADPYGSHRGLFFSHAGWTLTKKHPDVKAKGKTVDMSDLMNDPIMRFQHDHIMPLTLLIAIFIPTAIPVFLWNETWWYAFVANVMRFTIVINTAWAVNSFAHMYGTKAYDKYLSPCDNFSCAMLTLGEGYHNYHHTFPWDYKASELGKYSTNLTTAFIEMCGKIGWAYDFKTVSPDMIRKRVLRTGDGTHNVWGWTDKDMPQEDIDDAVVLNKSNGL